MKKKICLVIPTLQGGGAERNFIYLFRFLKRHGHDVSMLVFDLKGAFVSEVIGEDGVVNINKRGKFALVDYYRYLKSEKPDVVISTIAIANLFSGVLKLFFPKIKFICREANILSIENHGFVFDFLYRIFVHKADIVVAQSLDMKSDLINSYNIPSTSIEVINNPVDSERILSSLEGKAVALKDTDSSVVLLSVGRLAPQKGYLEFIRVLAETKGIDFMYYILGEGELKYEIEREVTRLGLEDRVKLLGFRDSPYAYMKAADFVVLPSLHEGFPNVLLESCVCGTPVLANNCMGGINEIVVDGFNGFVFDLAKAGHFNEILAKGIMNDWDRDSISYKTIEKYEVESVLDRYASLF